MLPTDFKDLVLNLAHLLLKLPEYFAREALLTMRVRVDIVFIRVFTVAAAAAHRAPVPILPSFNLKRYDKLIHFSLLGPE